jgi:hypothetical protein
VLRSENEVENEDILILNDNLILHPVNDTPKKFGVDEKERR